MSAGKISGNKEEIRKTATQGSDGFTLLELIVVLVIVGLISVLAAPRLIGSLTRTHLRTSVQKMTSALRYARSLAVSEQTTYAAVFDFEKRSCSIMAEKEEESDDPYAAVEKEASLTEEPSDGASEDTSYFLPETVKIELGVVGEEEFESESFKIRFFPIGNSSGGRVVLVDEKENRFQIEIDPITGIVKMTEPDESDL